MTVSSTLNATGADPYAWQRLALRPLLQPSDAATGLARTVFQGPAADEFLDFLRAHGLTQLWWRLLHTASEPAVPPRVADAMRDHARLTAADQLRQRRVLQELATLLDEQHIDWFVFKGAHLRDTLYPDPTLRPVSDVDVCVPPGLAAQAVARLRAAGFEAHADPATLSHELTLRRKSVDVDLHWHPLRPGRYRAGFTRWLFAHRQRFGALWGLDPTASLLIMLVHPAISKYLASPTSMLIHLVDQARLIHGGEVDWNTLAAALQRFGLRTPAWASLYFLHRLGDIEAPPEFAARIHPGRLRSWYLRQWIDRGWIGRCFAQRWFVAGLFSLVLQDSANDAGRALVMRFHSAGERPVPPN